MDVGCVGAVGNQLELKGFIYMRKLQHLYFESL